MARGAGPLKKVALERLLQGLEAVPDPRADLEQYPTPAGIAAEVAYLALAKGDLAGRRVLDAGCGNGILGIAAKLLGAATVVGVDVDPKAIEVAERNGRTARADVEWRCGDVASLAEAFDTVLMNPPFGSQTKHADLPFVDKALEVGRVVYSFHNAVTEGFVVRRLEAAGARVTDRLAYAFPVGRMFGFHREDRRAIDVVLLRTEVPKG